MLPRKKAKKSARPRGVMALVLVVFPPFTYFSLSLSLNPTVSRTIDVVPTGCGAPRKIQCREKRRAASFTGWLVVRRAVVSTRVVR